MASYLRTLTTDLRSGQPESPLQGHSPEEAVEARRVHLEQPNLELTYVLHQPRVARVALVRDEHKQYCEEWCVDEGW